MHVQIRWYYNTRALVVSQSMKYRKEKTMKLNRKINYLKLDRVEDHKLINDQKIRYYKCPINLDSDEFELLPSVTSILSVTLPKNNVNEWISRIGKENAELIKNESTLLGSMVHKIIEQKIKGENLDIEKEENNVDKILIMQAKSMANILLEKYVEKMDEITGIEENLWYPGLYSGTTDIIYIKNGKLFLGDFKTSKSIKRDKDILQYKLQLIAYSVAHEEVYNEKIKGMEIMMINRSLNDQYWYLDRFSIEYFSLYDKWIKLLDEFYNLNI